MIKCRAVTLTGFGPDHPVGRAAHGVGVGRGQLELDDLTHVGRHQHAGVGVGGEANVIGLRDVVGVNTRSREESIVVEDTVRDFTRRHRVRVLSHRLPTSMTPSTRLTVPVLAAADAADAEAEVPVLHDLAAGHVELADGVGPVDAVGYPARVS